MTTNYVELEVEGTRMIESQNCLQRNKKAFWLMLSLLNGALYGLTIPLSGGENLKSLLGIKNSNHASQVIYGLSAGAAICYTMFYYKTLESAKFKFRSSAQLMFSVFAPLAACGYLTGSVEGSKYSGLAKYAPEIGLFLYFCRMLSCVDASFKFPERMAEIKQSWVTATDNNRAEKIRLALTVLFSVGYALSSTDAIFSAVKIILGWLNANDEKSNVAAYVLGSLGAIGMFPLTLYWIMRGLRQLTNGGVENATGVNPDPTDRYTYLALLLVLPNILGVLGAAVSEEPKIFGRLGIFASVMRVSSSVVYATASGTPGVSTLFRSVAGQFSSGSKVETSVRGASYGTR